jgi:hypothetical protein
VNYFTANGFSRFLNNIASAFSAEESLSFAPPPPPFFLLRAIDGFELQSIAAGETLEDNISDYVDYDIRTSCFPANTISLGNLFTRVPWLLQCMIYALYKWQVQ